MASVPGKGGGMPKRSTERMGHRKSTVEKITVTGKKINIPPADPEWHTVARLWYESLPESGQSHFFEPSDWASAYYLAELINYNLVTVGFSATLFNATWAAMNDLLSTEGSRRRLRLELEREKAKPQSKQTIAMANYREILAA